MEKFSILKKWLRRHQRGLFWGAYGLIVLAVVLTSKWIMFCALLVALLLIGANADEYDDV